MTTTTPATKTAMIFAGEVFDGTDTAHPPARDLNHVAHTVRVRAMPARHLGKVLNVCTDEAALLELVCLVSLCDEAGKHVDWLPVDSAFIDNLDEPSHVMLVAAAQRLNFSRAANWVERQIAAHQVQSTLIAKQTEIMAPMVQEIVRSLVSSLPPAALSEKPVTKS
ncbi:MAG: hypothetical protein V4773_04905 [Verrucomicrobiota bacterium]